jgi:hypothetical protein
LGKQYPLPALYCALYEFESCELIPDEAIGLWKYTGLRWLHLKITYLSAPMVSLYQGEMGAGTLDVKEYLGKEGMDISRHWESN